MKTLQRFTITFFALSVLLAAGPTAAQALTNDEECVLIVVEPQCQTEILDLCVGLDDVLYAKDAEIGRLRNKIQQAENKLAANKAPGAEKKIGDVGEKIQSLDDGGPRGKGPKVFDAEFFTVDELLDLASDAVTCLSAIP